MALGTFPKVQRVGFSGLQGVKKPPLDPTDPRSVLHGARPQLQQAIVQPDAVLQAIAAANKDKTGDIRGALDLSNDPVLRMLRDYQARAQQAAPQPPGHSGVQSPDEGPTGPHWGTGGVGGTEWVAPPGLEPPGGAAGWKYDYWGGRYRRDWDPNHPGYIMGET